MMGTHSAYGLQGVLPSLALNVARLSRSGAAALPASTTGYDVRSLVTGYPVDKWTTEQEPPVQHMQPLIDVPAYSPHEVTVAAAASYSPEAEHIIADAVARWRALGFSVVVGRKDGVVLRFVPGWSR